MVCTHTPLPLTLRVYAVSMPQQRQLVAHRTTLANDVKSAEASLQRARYVTHPACLLARPAHRAFALQCRTRGYTQAPPGRRGS